MILTPPVAEVSELSVHELKNVPKRVDIHAFAMAPESDPYPRLPIKDQV